MKMSSHFEMQDANDPEREECRLMQRGLGDGLEQDGIKGRGRSMFSKIAFSFCAQQSIARVVEGVPWRFGHMT